MFVAVALAAGAAHALSFAPFDLPWLQLLALAVLFGAQAGASVLGGVQRWQGPLQTVNASLIIAIGTYLTLSASLRVI